VQPAAIWVLAGLVALAAFFVGLGFGRSASRRTAARARELEERLSAADDEMARYRSQVSEHFAETSTLLRDLTLQYRSVYEHLAEGARTLCPEGAQLLAPSLAEAALPAAATAAAPPEIPAIGDAPDPELAGSGQRAVGPLEHDGLGPLLDEAEPGWNAAANTER
jgi:uncharacterized membrane-anchored protein YhcB (DUF1043 family)